MDPEHQPDAIDEMASSADAAAAAVAVADEFDAVDPSIKEAAQKYSDMFPSLPTPAAPRQPLKGGVWDKVATAPTARKPAAQAPRTAVPKGKQLERITYAASERQLNDKRLADALRQIGVQTNAQIQHTTSAQGVVTISVIGTPSEIQQARRRIGNTVGTRVEARMIVPRRLHASLIGSGGSNLTALQDRTGARINFPGPNSQSEEVTITGDVHAVAAARQELGAAIAERDKAAAEAPAAEIVRIDRSLQPFVFGVGQQTLREIQEATQTKITPVGDADDVKVSGPRESVSKAVERLNALLAEKRATIKSIAIVVNRKLHPALIGPKRASLLEIERATGCVVDVPAASAESDQVTIRGVEANMMTALNMVMDKVNTLVVEEVVVQPPAALAYLRTHGADRVREFDALNVNLTFSDKTIDLIGARENVAAARAKVYALVNHYSSFGYAQFDVPLDLLPLVLGKDERALTKAKADFKVDVVVPKHEGDKLVVVATDKSKLPAAQAYFANLVKEASALPHEEYEIATQHRGGLAAVIKELSAKYERALVKASVKGVSIRAPKNDLAAIKARLDAYVEEQRRYEAEHSFTAEVKIESRYVKYIIGKNETAIARVRDQTGTTIEVKKSETKAAAKGEAAKPAPAAGSGAKGKKGGETAAAAPVPAAESAEYEVFFIKGTKEGVAEAAKIIKERAREIAEGGGMITDELKVDRRFHGTLIGKQGANLTSLKNRHGVNIKFPEPDSDSDVITISGLKVSVNKAKNELLELLEFEKAQRHRETLPLDKAFMATLFDGTRRTPRLIGFARDNDVRIEMSPTSDGVAITGEKSAVARAIKQLKEMQSVAANSVTVELELPRKVFPQLIGTKGVRIQEFKAKHPGVTVRFSEPNQPDRVTISGLADAVKAAEAELRKAADELSEERIEVPVPGGDLRSQLVRDLIRSIGEKHSVRILLPSAGQSKQLLAIVGKEDKCKAAEAELAALEIGTATGDLPVAARRFVVTDATLRDLCQSLNVSLQCPAPGDESPTYTIKGRAADVEAAKDRVAEAIQAIVARAAPKGDAGAAAGAVKEEISVPVEQHGLIIGRGGSTVQALQTTHDVRITIKKSSSVIAVQGATKEAVTAAIDAIRALVAEVRVAIDPRHFAFIIGPGGSRLRDFEREYGVSIQLPRGRNATGDVVIRPRAEGADLEKAKEALLQQVAANEEAAAAGEAAPDVADAGEAADDLEEGEIPQTETKNTDLFFVAAAVQATARPQAAGVWANAPSFK